MSTFGKLYSRINEVSREVKGTRGDIAVVLFADILDKKFCEWACVDERSLFAIKFIRKTFDDGFPYSVSQFKWVRGVSRKWYNEQKDMLRKGLILDSEVKNGSCVSPPGIRFTIFELMSSGKNVITLYLMTASSSGHKDCELVHLACGEAILDFINKDRDFSTDVLPNTL